MIWTILSWAAVILVVLWIAKHPETASNDIHGIGKFLSGVAS
jgi:hypothetical protein